MRRARPSFDVLKADGRNKPDMDEQIANPVDFTRSAIPRYLQLATLFRRRIATGTWPVGDQIPTVDELALSSGVARATVRQALDVIESEGLIQRFRAKGTFVIRAPGDDLWCAVETDWAGLLRANHEAKIEILETRKNVVIDRVPYPMGEIAPLYRRLRRRHWRKSEPFLLTDVLIDERLMDRISNADIKGKTALRLINDVRGLKIADARQTLTIATADIDSATSLMMPLNAPVAIVYRRVVDAAGTLVLAAEGIYRGDVVRFDVKLK